MDAGGSLTTLEFEIICNKSLSDKFDLYYRDKEKYLGKWSPFNFTLETYWKTRE